MFTGIPFCFCKHLSEVYRSVCVYIVTFLSICIYLSCYVVPHRLFALFICFSLIHTFLLSQMKTMGLCKKETRSSNCLLMKIFTKRDVSESIELITKVDLKCSHSKKAVRVSDCLVAESNLHAFLFF